MSVPGQGRQQRGTEGERILAAACSTEHNTYGCANSFPHWRRPGSAPVEALSRRVITPLTIVAS